MKKSLLLTLEFPPHKGGTQKYYSDICESLPSDKITVLTIIQELDTKSVQYKIYRKNLITNYIWPKWLPMIWHVWRIIKKEKIELIQVGQVLPCGTVALIIKKIFKIPYVVYTHGLDILIAQKNVRKKELVKKILESADTVISNSEFVKTQVIKLGVQERKIVVVYPSVEVHKSQESSNKDQEELRAKYNLENKKVLLTVCRLVDRKGVDLVIRALVSISEKIDNTVYVIVGDGPKKEELKSLVSDSEDIIFAGRVDDEELNTWYILCDVFILTPKKSDFDIEGFGIVYIEANRYGKPVIGSRMSGIEEAVENGVSGLLVEPSDVKQIGDAVVKLLNDDNLKSKLGEQGRIRAEQIFSHDSQLELVKTIIN